MPVEYTIDAGTGFIRFTTAGSPTPEEQQEQWLRALADPRAARPLRVLDDRRQIERIGTPEDTIRFSSDAKGRLDLLRGARLAFVASKAVTFGMTRMFEARSLELPFEVRPFYDVAEAEAWLAEP